MSFGSNNYDRYAHTMNGCLRTETDMLSVGWREALAERPAVPENVHRPPTHVNVPVPDSCGQGGDMPRSFKTRDTVRTSEGDAAYGAKRGT